MTLKPRPTRRSASRYRGRLGDISRLAHMVKKLVAFADSLDSLRSNKRPGSRDSGSKNYESMRIGGARCANSKRCFRICGSKRRSCARRSPRYEDRDLETTESELRATLSRRKTAKQRSPPGLADSIARCRCRVKLDGLDEEVAAKQREKAEVETCLANGGAG